MKKIILAAIVGAFTFGLAACEQRVETTKPMDDTTTPATSTIIKDTTTTPATPSTTAPTTTITPGSDTKTDVNVETKPSDDTTTKP